MLVGVFSAMVAAITLSSTDGQGKTSFTDGARWSDLKPPSSLNEYVVANGYDIRSPATSGSYSDLTNAVFAGKSLTLGDSSKGGHLIVKTTCGSSRGIAKVTVGDLRLAHSGSYIEHGGNSAYTELDGKITISVNQGSVTGSSVPYFQSSDSRYLDVSAELVSASGKGFKVILAPNKTTPFHLALLRDNPNYLGYMAAGNDGIYLTAESSGALGPNPETPTALLNLRNGGAFGVEYAANELVIDQPNRGIHVSSTAGGRLYAAKNRTLTTSMFVSSGTTASPVEKIGDGNFFLSGEYAAGDITVSGGWLGLAGDVTRSVILADKCYFGPATRSSTLSLSGPVTFQGSSSFRFRFVPSESQTGVIELKGGFTSNVWPIPFVLEGSLPMQTCTQTLFRVATSVRRVSNADFSCRNAAKSGYNRLIEVVTDADGWQTVRQVQSVQVKMKEEIVGATDDVRHRFLEPDPWDDGLAPSAEKDYQVGTNQTIRTGAATADSVVFPGHQLKLSGTTDHSGPATLMLKAKETTVPHLMFKGKSVLNVAAYSGYGDHQEQVLNGAIDMVDAYAYVYASYDRIVSVNAAIAGNGVLHLCPNVRNESVAYKNQMRVALVGDNSAYRGGFLLTGKSDGGNKTDIGDEGVTPVELIVADEKNVGGNPDSYQEDAFRLSARCMLTVTNSLTLQNPNRPVKVVNFASMKVADGKTLTVSAPLILHGILTKVGGGTLAVARLDPGSKTKAISLVEGFVEASSTNGFDGVSVTMSAGTAIRVAGDTVDSALASYGFYDVANDEPLAAEDGARLNFVVDDPQGKLAASAPSDSRVAVLTVSAVSADALADRLCVRRLQDGRRLVVEKCAPDAADRVTFRATPGSHGLVLIFK